LDAAAPSLAGGYGPVAEDTTLHSLGFKPVAGADSRVLILGTLPGPVSLEKRQYYAQSRNAFWPIMGELIGAAPELTYRERLDKLKSRSVALWDVCQSAYRVGALDASIDAGSIVPNDLAGFLRTHATIRLICFNGQTAAKLYRQRVLPGLPAGLRDIRCETLPSTSPAYAAMQFEQKLEEWQIVRRAAGRIGGRTG
jgi:hypoxanthine-DNA glycosylase